MKLNILAFAAAAVCAVACVQPRSQESFCKEAPYKYEVAVADTAAAYDMSFYAVIGEAAPGVMTLESYAPMAIEVTWTAPSGQSCSETVYMEVDGCGTLVQKYRTGVKMPEPGSWSFEAKLDGTPKHFQGLGFIFEKQQ